MMHNICSNDISVIVDATLKVKTNSPKFLFGHSLFFYITILSSIHSSPVLITIETQREVRNNHPAFCPILMVCYILFGSTAINDSSANGDNSSDNDTAA